MDGEQTIYKKEDGQLYFKPYGKEDKVSAYFSNDMIKVNLGSVTVNEYPKEY
jgi:hypothetical protein